MDRTEKTEKKAVGAGAKKLFAGMNKNRLFLFVMGAAGILLMTASGLFGGKTETQTPAYADVDFYTAYLEERIEELCVSIGGIDEASVFLTVDCSSEYVYGESGGSDYLILTGEDGEEAVLLCEIYPRVRGVAVVCTGGDRPQVQETVAELLSAALDLPFSKIRIAGK